jgi:glucokinase
MIPFTFRQYVGDIPKNSELLLGGDIGGTNSNFGFFQQKDNKLILLFSLHAKSKEIKNFTDIVRDLLAYVRKEYGISCKRACFAAAGVPSQDRMFCKPTNLSLLIDIQDILDKTNLDCAFVVNDFLVIGYGLNLIHQDNLVLVNKGHMRHQTNKAIVGAGTGLGKSILYWSEEPERYIPLPSEGGHADLAAQNQLEFDLIQFIQETENRTCTVSWEDVLSGDGIKRLYRFFMVRAGKDIHDVGNGPHPDEIFKQCNKSQQCFETFQLYTTFYARCAKNFALDALALGGLYIAGGIAAKNLPLFKQEAFMKEFINCGKQKALLAHVPIFVITDYNVSLYGAALFLILDGTC